MKYINEGNLYRLIVNCTLPVADSFESWIFDVVLPSIRRKGYYGVRKSSADCFDARDIPYERMSFMGGDVKVIDLDGERWYCIPDIHACIGSQTETTQCVRRLNAKRQLTRKIHLFGIPNPGWFTNELGVRLLLCGSTKLDRPRQLVLDFGGKEVE